MDITGVGGAGGMHAVSGASTSGPPQQKMSDLFDSIDSSGSGSITQSQFDQAFQSKNPPTVFQQQGADAIFTALDPNGTGSVSKQDFVSGM
jgi:Ca2+-binding EF-hand superfamily protein